MIYLGFQNSQSCGWCLMVLAGYVAINPHKKHCPVGGGMFQPTYMCHILCYQYQYLFIQFSVASDMNLRFALSPPSGYILIQNLHIKSTLEACCTLIPNSKSYDYITYFPNSSTFIHIFKQTKIRAASFFLILDFLPTFRFKLRQLGMQRMPHIDVTQPAEGWGQLWQNLQGSFGRHLVEWRLNGWIFWGRWRA